MNYLRVILCFSVVLFSCKEGSKRQEIPAQEIEEQPAIKFKTVEGVKLASGKLLRIEAFPSQYIKPRPVDVWLPEDYSENKKYSVLYMHDGQMLFDSTTTWNKQEWKVDEWASKLMNDNNVKNFIVVAPHNKSDIRKSDYFPQKPFESLPVKTQDSLFMVSKRDHLTMNTINSDNYLRFLVEELKPAIDSEFSVHSDVENTFVMGSSMGGLISMYAICEYPEVFGAAACLSTHWIGTYTQVNNPIPNAFFEYMKAHLPDSKTHRLYFDYGTHTLDEKYLMYQDEVSQILSDKGYDINLKFDGADHSENSWNQRLDQPLTFLLSKTK